MEETKNRFPAHVQEAIETISNWANEDSENRPFFMMLANEEGLRGQHVLAITGTIENIARNLAVCSLSPDNPVQTLVCNKILKLADKYLSNKDTFELALTKRMVKQVTTDLDPDKFADKECYEKLVSLLNMLKD